MGTDSQSPQLFLHNRNLGHRLLLHSGNLSITLIFTTLTPLISLRSQPPILLIWTRTPLQILHTIPTCSLREDLRQASHLRSSQDCPRCNASSWKAPGPSTVLFFSFPTRSLFSNRRSISSVLLLYGSNSTISPWCFGMVKSLKPLLANLVFSSK